MIILFIYLFSTSEYFFQSLRSPLVCLCGRVLCCIFDSFSELVLYPNLVYKARAHLHDWLLKLNYYNWIFGAVADRVFYSEKCPFKRLFELWSVCRDGSLYCVVVQAQLLLTLSKVPHSLSHRRSSHSHSPHPADQPSCVNSGPFSGPCLSFSLTPSPVLVIVFSCVINLFS